MWQLHLENEGVQCVTVALILTMRAHMWCTHHEQVLRAGLELKLVHMQQF